MRCAACDACAPSPSWLDGLVLVWCGQVGRGAMQELDGLLNATDCTLQSLDLSFTQVDGWSLVQSLKRNRSLTSLNLTQVPKIDLMYKELAALFEPADATGSPSPTQLGYLRCDAFDLHEGERVLSLRETPIAPAALKLLAALLTRNSTCTELDLTASDVEKEGATALAKTLGHNSTLTALRLSYNPALDETSRTSLRQAAAATSRQIALDV
jgi:hypothetical protein